MFYADNFCKYEEVWEHGKHFYVFSGSCKLTKKPHSVKVPVEGLYRYRQGAMIQDAFPEMSPGDREFLITGYTPEGWSRIFPEEGEAVGGEG